VEAGHLQYRRPSYHNIKALKRKVRAKTVTNSGSSVIKAFVSILSFFVSYCTKTAPTIETCTQNRVTLNNASDYQANGLMDY